jgi:hypothetical protein
MSSLFGRTAMLLSGLILVLPGMLIAASAAAPFAGSWVLNAAKSEGDSKLTELTIHLSPDGQVKFDSVLHKGDADVKAEFECTTNGKDCEWDQSGHKSKVSMWFNGPALVVMKSDGPAEDSASQWKLEAAADGKTLTLTLSHILPDGKDETLVFDKK